MITHDPRWSLTRGNTLVPSRWQATATAPSVQRRGDERVPQSMQPDRLALDLPVATTATVPHPALALARGVVHTATT